MKSKRIFASWYNSRSGSKRASVFAYSSSAICPFLSGKNEDGEKKPSSDALWETYFGLAVPLAKIKVFFRRSHSACTA